MVAEAKNAIASFFDRHRANGISPFRVVGEMLPTVEFYDEPCLMTYEVGDVASNWHLAPKASARQAMAAKLRPENAFHIGAVAPKCPGI